LDAAIEKPFTLASYRTTEGDRPYRGLEPEITAFDIDGVVADTMRLFIDILRESYKIEHLRQEDITSYDLEECLDLDSDIIAAAIQQIISGQHAPHLHPIAGCGRHLTRFGQNGRTLRFVTARPEAGIIRTWLENLLPLDPQQIDVVATGSFDGKIDVLRAAGARVFVEDRLETCFLLSSAGITPIVYIQPWNRYPHPFREVGSWDEIAAMMAA
jgi:uncharacterized HAD superfamily protein